MDPKILMQINEIYRNEVYAEPEPININQWVNQLISEGYDLDDYSDEELYEAYLEDLDERNRGERGMSSLEVYKRRNLQFRDPRKTSSGIEDYSSGYRERPTATLLRYHELKGKERESEHTKTRGTKTKGMREQADLYDIVSEYLVSEGFCDSYEDADVIMANMSEEWRESIVNTLIEEGFVSPYKEPHAHGRSIDNPGRLSPAMRAMDRSDKLQTTEPGSERQKLQTRRSNQLNRLFSAARRA